MVDPILIMATPRSGSSMTAGLFAKHGVFTGKVRPGQGRNPKGFFESTSIREIVRTHNGRLVHTGVAADRIPGFRDKVEAAMIAEGYTGGPWLWKGSAIYWPAWYEFEAPKWVVCRRDIEATIRSLQKPPYALATTDYDRLKFLVERHHQEIDTLVELGAFEVDTQAVAQGDFSTIKRAIEGCGLTYQQAIVEAFVDPNQWHEVA